jgi:hypothetical protein
VPGILDDIDFIARDSKRFLGTGGWGYAQFDCNAASDTFTPEGDRLRVRLCVPYDRGGKRLHFHGVREAVTPPPPANL